MRSDSNGTCLVFTHKHCFHRKDAKDAKWFIYFVNKFPCELCVYSVSLLLYVWTLTNHGNTQKGS